MPPSPRRPAPRPALPVVTVSGSVPGSARVLALATRPGDDGPVPAGADLPEGMDLAGLLSRESASGGPGDLVAVPLPSGGPRDRLLLLGTGDASPAALRTAGAAVARRASGTAEVTVDLRGADAVPAAVGALVEAALLASYGFTESPTATPRVLTAITVVVDDPDAVRAEVDRAVVVARSVAAARDLVNTPPLVKTPAWLAQAAVALLSGLEVRVRDEHDLAAEGFGGIVGVGMGSTRPPRLVQATYDGGGGRHVVLVGKGITFDSGGLSLKPTDGMLTMKNDMGGAAAVLCALRAAADLALPLRITALVAAAENMPSGTAQRPGDVLVQYGGRTVEVLNTDAEGRLVLADALAYADAVLDPDVLVDVATLTGAMPVALGRRTAGMFASDDAVASGLEHAAQASGEPLWRLPLVEDYRLALDSPTADLRNIGDPKKKLQGGSITAALFLREFTGGRPWAHLDIAGTAWSGSDEDELTKGGTGYGVRLLVAWLTGLSA